LEENITRLKYEEKEIILIATAHVSSASAALVKEVVEKERPDSVCVELDEERYRTIQTPDAWKKTDIVEVIKTKRVGFLLANLFLSAYQKKIAGQLNTKAGQEMIQGIESAKTVKANLVTADRKIQTTFLRIWRKLGLFEKLKLLFNLVFSFEDDSDLTEQDLQKMLQSDMLEAAMSGVREQFPKIGEILITERDQYLANKIKNAPGRKIIAILGGAHVPGVSKEIFETQDMDAISEVPDGKPVYKAIAWIIPAVFLAVIAFSFVVNIQTGLRQIASWFIWNSGFAALFTLLALGHPLSILTSLICAPFTSVNPLLACGWFTGLVEASLRKPTVADVERVPEDVLHVKGFFKNPFLRIILIVFMANLGSTIGSFVAGLDIVKSLFHLF
jgi:pheromone shutdown-related protein TraB